MAADNKGLNELLQQVLWAETLREVMRRLTPQGTVVAWLRVCGLSEEEIAAWLGVSPRTVRRWMAKVRVRIGRELPEAAVFLKGRGRGER